MKDFGLSLGPESEDLGETFFRPQAYHKRPYDRAFRATGFDAQGAFRDVFHPRDWDGRGLFRSSLSGSLQGSLFDFLSGPPRRISSRDSATLSRGETLGKYRLVTRIGDGGFASVWKAWDSIECRHVALKIANDSLVASRGRTELEREARIAASLSHPHIATLHTADWIDDRFVLVFDLALTHLGRFQKARRSPRLALDIVRQVASALAHAHERGVMHRDVKPENILIFEDERAALTDFGLSRFCGATLASCTEAGTMGYVAPEQVYGRPTFGSDVFSLGLVTYKLITGELLRWPFEWPPKAHDVFKSRVPNPLQPVIRRAATFDPSRRYEDAVALHHDFERAFTRVFGARRISRRRNPVTTTGLEISAEYFHEHFGANLEMHFNCFQCEGPIAESMRYCPWCGTDENSFSNVTAFAAVCPHCERGVQPHWRSCPWCSRVRPFSIDDKGIIDVEADRRCTRPTCRGELRRFMRFCPTCHEKVRRPWRHPDLDASCSRCCWPVSSGFWLYCPWCGRCGRKETRATSASRKNSKTR